MKRKQTVFFILLVVPVLILLLGAYPGAVRMDFWGGPGTEAITEYCSCYDMLAVGYGHWGPLLTMAAAAAVLILNLCGKARPCRGLRTAMKVLSVLVVLLPCFEPVLTGRTTWVLIVLSLLGAVLTLASFAPDPKE